MGKRTFSKKQAAAVAKITSPMAALSRTASLFGGGVGGALGGAASGGLGSLASQGTGGFLNGIKGLGQGEGLKGFLTGLGKQFAAAKNETFDIFRNIRGNDSSGKRLDPGEPEDNVIGLSPQDFLRSINAQFGQGVRK